jgi:hypothetical protein
MGFFDEEGPSINALDVDAGQLSAGIRFSVFWSHPVHS